MERPQKLTGRASVKSALEEELVLHIRALGLPEPERQVHFSPSRRWLADFVWPASNLLVEVEGGTWSGGRHVRGTGFETDCEKLNAAVLLGYRVLRFTAAMVHDGRAVTQIAEALKEQKHEGGCGL